MTDEVKTDEVKTDEVKTDPHTVRAKKFEKFRISGGFGPVTLSSLCVALTNRAMYGRHLRWRQVSCS